jgi:hypothetical protein
LRVAVLASGFLHGAPQSAENFKKHVLEPLGADLYVFTSRENVVREAGGSKHTAWLTGSEIQKVIQTWRPFLKNIEFIEDRRYYRYDLSLALDWYNKRLERFKPRCVPEYVAHEYRMSCIDQYLRLNRCWNIMYGAYDVVCRIRPDLVFENPLSIERIEDNVLYVPCKEGFYRPETSPFYLKEFMFWGGRDVMDKICLEWVNAYGIPEPLFEPGGSDYTLCPEHQFGLYVKERGFMVEFVPLTCRYSEAHRAYEVVKAEDCPGENRVRL